ncbi:MAG: Endopeptidase Clp [Actinomycetia bacterium]|nr:Endopeptidase Clp [Actinomycetes bacterium]
MQLHLNSAETAEPSEPVTPHTPIEPSPPTPPGPPPVATFGEELSRRMLTGRRIMLTGPIDDNVANAICSQLLVLEADGDAPVTLYINSPGGSVDSGFAIYDTMQTLGCAVATVCVGLAASMGQFILCAGTPGKRYAHRHSSVLMHQPHGAVQGVATDIAIQAEHFAHMRRLMAERTAFHTGQPVERVVADADRDKWFTAEEALEYGFVDEVLDAPLKLVR